jgi:hypothetical protein
MNPESAIYADLFDTVTGDATVKSLCGGTVSLYRGEATIDPKHGETYLILDITLNDLGSDDSFISEGDDVFFEIFDEGDDPEVAADIADRLIRLLEGKQAVTPEGDASYSLRNGRDYSIDAESPSNHSRGVIFWCHAAALGRIGAIVP